MEKASAIPMMYFSLPQRRIRDQKDRYEHNYSGNEGWGNGTSGARGCARYGFVLWHSTHAACHMCLNIPIYSWPKKIAIILSFVLKIPICPPTWELWADISTWDIKCSGMKNCLLPDSEMWNKTTPSRVRRGLIGNNFGSSKSDSSFCTISAITESLACSSAFL